MGLIVYIIEGKTYKEVLQIIVDSRLAFNRTFL